MPGTSPPAFPPGWLQRQRRDANGRNFQNIRPEPAQAFAQSASPATACGSPPPGGRKAAAPRTSFSSPRSFTTSPTTVIAGALKPRCLARSAMVARVPSRLSWRAVVPQRTSATRRLRRGALLHQPLRDEAEPLDPHEENLRAAQLRQLPPVERRIGLGRVLVAGDEGHHRGEIAVRHRDARIGRGRDGRGHAGTLLERNARAHQFPRLLAPRARRRRDRRPSAAPPLFPARAWSISSALISSCASVWAEPDFPA